jgi:hypothetical protein
MNIDIRMTTNRESPALRQFAEHALLRKLGQRVERIRRARIRMSDANGPRGGVDKICQVRLDLAGGGEVSATGESSGWYEAVTIAVMSARGALDRRLDRTRVRKTKKKHSFESADRGSTDTRRPIA